MIPDPETLMADLRPARLPQGFDAFSGDGILAILALALLGGVCLALLIMAVTRLRPSLAATARRSLDAARGLDPSERLLVQARLAGELAKAVNRRRNAERAKRLAAIGERLSAELYRPKPSLDPNEMDGEILAAIGGRG